MKTQRRHELQTNELADYLGRHIQQIRPHAKALSIGAVALVAMILGYLYFASQHASQSGSGWSDYFTAFGDRSADRLEEAATRHAGTTAGLWARQAAGDIKLASGAGLLYTDRKEADKNLKQAEQHFKAVEKEAGGATMLVERARFGLAQVYESLCDVKKAREYYQKVANANPNSALGKAAQRRFDHLGEDSVKRWYAWFERQEPVLASRGKPAGKEEPKVSENLEDLSEKPDLNFPTVEPPKDAGPPPAEKPQEQPAAEKPQQKPAAEKAQEPPAAEKPASSPAKEPPAPAADKAAPAPAPATPAPDRPAAAESK